jgi:hypothetical protein
MARAKAVFGPETVNWPHRDLGPWQYTLTWTFDAQGLRCTHLTVGTTDPEKPLKITTEVLRKVPVAALTRMFGDHLVREFELMEKEHDEPGLGELGREIAGNLPRFVVRDRTSIHYRTVATVYRSAVARGDPRPTQAVREELNAKSTAVAASWVRRARLQGFLGPSPGRGRLGEAPEG